MVNAFKQMPTTSNLSAEIRIHARDGDGTGRDNLATIDSIPTVWINQMRRRRSTMAARVTLISRAKMPNARAVAVTGAGHVGPLLVDADLIASTVIEFWQTLR